MTATPPVPDSPRTLKVHSSAAAGAAGRVCRGGGGDRGHRAVDVSVARQPRARGRGRPAYARSDSAARRADVGAEGCGDRAARIPADGRREISRTVFERDSGAARQHECATAADGGRYDAACSVWKRCKAWSPTRCRSWPKPSRSGVRASGGGDRHGPHRSRARRHGSHPRAGRGAGSRRARAAGATVRRSGTTPSRRPRSSPSAAPRCCCC